MNAENKNPDLNEIKIKRLNRKIENRNKKIAGLNRRIQDLESALSTRTMDLKSLTYNIERSVTNALCNVRMFPVHDMGFSKTTKIISVEVKNSDSE